MESEPEYVYKPGEGWVVSNRPQADIVYRFTHSGKNWIFEYRNPTPDEYYLYFYGEINVETMSKVADILTTHMLGPERYYKGEAVYTDGKLVVYREDVWT
jgi:hypothetical protein